MLAPEIKEIFELEVMFAQTKLFIREELEAQSYEVKSNGLAGDFTGYIFASIPDTTRQLCILYKGNTDRFLREKMTYLEIRLIGEEHNLHRSSAFDIPTSESKIIYDHKVDYPHLLFQMKGRALNHYSR